MNGIWKAAHNGDFDLVASELDRGVRPDTPDDFGFTPLHTAAVAGQLRCAEVLLRRRANLNARTLSGSTPAHLAARAGHVLLLALLVERNADVTLADDAGHTPLHEALLHGQTRCAELLQHGVPVAQRPADLGCPGLPTPPKVTPLMHWRSPKSNELALSETRAGRQFYKFSRTPQNTPGNNATSAVDRPASGANGSVRVSSSTGWVRSRADALFVVDDDSDEHDSNSPAAVRTYRMLL
eukprot:TRINITY_DN9683_c0_g1_i1.p1 TRINITY_DN9683_c0_g1~~TRINITY_DN9683_c0_g1_i1.p1  ORF type:complete len:239 (-),score=47.08 TRINITY_DN9683_c0_g1_i1:3-719(-)